MTGTPEGSDRSNDLGSLEAIAAKAREIYEREFKEKYESSYPGYYVAVDVVSEKAYPHETSAGALQDARKDEPHGLFHVVRVGAKEAFRTTRSVKQNGYEGWPA